jgi:hypothetical protein
LPLNGAAHHRSSFAFGLAQARDTIALFPLTALLEQFNSLKAFKNVSFPAQSGSRAQTTML